MILRSVVHGLIKLNWPAVDIILADILLSGKVKLTTCRNHSSASSKYMHPLNGTDCRAVYECWSSRVGEGGKQLDTAADKGR